MPISETKRKQIETLKEKARILYQELGTYRLVGKAIGKSHQWVANAVHEKSTIVDNSEI